MTIAVKIGYRTEHAEVVLRGLNVTFALDDLLEVFKRINILRSGQWE